MSLVTDNIIDFKMAIYLFHPKLNGAVKKYKKELNTHYKKNPLISKLIELAY